MPTGALAQPSGIDPQATKLLKASTDFLAAQKRFSAETRNSLEVVLTSGQKIQFDHVARLSVLRPDKLRADRVGDLVEQSFFFDSKSLTLFNPREKYYATVAPGRWDLMPPSRSLLHEKPHAQPRPRGDVDQRVQAEQFDLPL